MKAKFFAATLLSVALGGCVDQEPSPAPTPPPGARGPEGPPPSDGVREAPPADAIPEARAAETLADWAALLPAEGAAIELCAVEADDVPTAIVRAAARLDADVILVGTHGRTGVARVVRSSVAERVARTAGCSVFIVRKKRGG